MKRKRRQSSKKASKSVTSAVDGGQQFTMFDQLDALTHELREQVGLAPVPGLPKPRMRAPAWCRNIALRLCKTIFKPLLKLRPAGEMNWRHYGRMIGILERVKTFWRSDVPRLIQEKLGGITDDEFERILPYLGLDQFRARYVMLLGRPVADDEPLEDLVNELWEREVAYMDRLRAIAWHHVAQQPAKICDQFWKGYAEGYSGYLDVAGKFAGDRGRTEVYINLLIYMEEVEQIRRTQLPTSRAKFYDSMAGTFRMLPKAYDWFNDVCDDIKFPLNNLGRPRRQLVQIG